MVLGQSKSFVLNWEMDRELELSNGTKLRMPLIENNFVNDDGIPDFQDYWDIGYQYNRVSYKLRNVVFETLNDDYVKLLSLELIPEELVSSLEISHSPKMHGLSLSITPLVYKDGVVKKVVSFDLKYQLSSRSAKSLFL